MQRQILLAQLPVPKPNFGLNTGNIPLAAACLAQAADDIPDTTVRILDPVLATHGGDALILDRIIDKRPDILGFTLYAWNIDRSLFLAEQARQRIGCRILAGGPEMTDDNSRIPEHGIDHRVSGDGEAAFRRLLLRHPDNNGSGRVPSGADLFTQSPSPYATGHIRAGQGEPLFLETQRGCPFSCGFCRYDTTGGRVIFKPDTAVLETVRYAKAHGVREVFFLDPTLNARPGLPDLLRQLADLNPDHGLSFASEIRADRVDRTLAELFRRAGFTEFEIGLQTITPKALELMGRPTRTASFLEGCRALKDAGIRLKTDLIVGLPGDDITGFMASLEFVIRNGLADDIQVFPLLVLPGTRFRKESRKLGLAFQADPPYTVRRTPGFSARAVSDAFDAAEERLGLALLPLPDLDIAWKTPGPGGDRTVDLGGDRAVAKVLLNRKRPREELVRTARLLASPCQVFVFPGHPPEALAEVLACLTGPNPFTPLELVFLEPRTLPDTAAVLASARLHRPHFIDNELALLFPEPGNRALMMTLVSRSVQPVFRGAMMRQVFWWQYPRLPEPSDLKAFQDLDGILLDVPVSPAALSGWQDRMAPGADALPLISFSQLTAQRRWQTLVSPDALDPRIHMSSNP